MLLVRFHFFLTARELKMRLAQNVEIAFCSRSCAGTFNFKRGIISLKNNEDKRYNSLNDEDITKIKELRKQKLSVYKIAELTGFARNTVMKYW